MKRIMLLLALLLAVSWPVAAQDSVAKITVMNAFDLDGEAADADQIVVVGNGALTDSKTFTLTADPDVCRLIDITVTDADSSITAGTLTVAGLDCLGYATSCTFTFAAGGSGVKTLTGAAYGGACYLSDVTSVTTGALTGEGAGDTVTVGYTTNSANGWAMYGTRSTPGPNGEHGVNPFGYISMSKLITTSGASSTTVTDVNGADDAFALAAVGDLITFTVRDSSGLSAEYERKITAKASADSVTIDSAVNIPAAGVTWKLRKLWFSTNPYDRMVIPMTGWGSARFTLSVAATNANTGGIVGLVECGTYVSNSFKARAVSAPVFPSGSTGTASVTVPGGSGDCRYGLSFGTGDDADAGAESITLTAELFTENVADAETKLPTYYTGKTSATDTNTAVSFGCKAYSVRIANDGANEVFYDYADTTATTSNVELLGGEKETLGLGQEYSRGVGIAGIGLICSAGETATVRVHAMCW